MKTNNLKIYANSGFVGELTANEYSRLKTVVKKDKRLYAAQAANIGHTSFTIVWRMVRSIPWVWFTAAVILAMVMPAEFNSTISRLLADPESASIFFLNTVRIALILSLTMLPIKAMVSGDSFGFIDQFNERLHLLIRTKFNLPPMCVLFIDEVHVLDGPQSQANIRLVKPEEQ